MSMPSEHVSDLYTRKVGGESYTYTVDYSLGPRVEWQAQVFKDGDLKGRPAGVLLDNTLIGNSLRQTVISLVEVTIENMIGIEE
ncbi:MAG: hypothetical protein H7327_02110 [Herminiimonas sp.]|nr:hypothetical protein [Herminiimonas sp.]